MPTEESRLTWPHIERVAEFHLKFDVPVRDVPQQLPADEFLFRLTFLHEELNEFLRAYMAGDLEKQVDALIDLEYVLHGTALMMGLLGAWTDHHLEVHAANMRKVAALTAEAGAAGSGRPHKFDVIKPPGWVAPDHLPILRRYGWQP